MPTDNQAQAVVVQNSGPLTLRAIVTYAVSFICDGPYLILSNLLCSLQTNPLLKV